MKKPTQDKRTDLKATWDLFGRIYRPPLFSLLFLLPCLAWADEDPMSKAGTAFYGILFGTLGTTLCAIIMGATFILAKVGKVSWDKFLYIGFCVAGFIGTPSIIALIRSAVGQ
jgi:hypothetical protein